MSEFIDHITDDNGYLIAIILQAGYDTPGINFISGPELSQQIGVLQHKAGHVIQPHTHLEVPRKVVTTQEVLYIQSGKVEVDLFDDMDRFVCTKTLVANDMIHLIRGGHGFRVIEDAKILEIKNGPYVGTQDKRRF